jgi:hypothetical protein
MLDFYVLQDQLYGLGNFINLTPALRAISDKKGEPVPVYFELDHVAECFKDCPFITRVEKQPYERALFSSGLVDHHNKLPDYVYAYLHAGKLFEVPDDPPHTYIDQADEIPKHDYDYTLFMYGSGNEDPLYMNMKTPQKHYYTEHMNMMCGESKDIFTGSVTDFNRVNWFNHMEHYLNDIRKSLALIRDAKYIVSNDTGLAHAAGAMNKEILILWKTTKLPKNGNPGKNTRIKLCL